jgi:hypothetical protein
MNDLRTLLTAVGMEEDVPGKRHGIETGFIAHFFL